MKQLEILVEEPSMKNALEWILPRVLPEDYALGYNCFIRTHDGKQHLQKSLPPKIRAYANFPYPVRVLVLQDQDSNDCRQLKQKLKRLIEETGFTTDYLIRIVCKELECWYAGDLKAVEKVYPQFNAAKHQRKAKFRNPDRLQCAEEFSRIIPGFTKHEASRYIPQHMQLNENNSESFRQFISGLQSWLKKENVRRI